MIINMLLATLFIGAGLFEIVAPPVTMMYTIYGFVFIIAGIYFFARGLDPDA